MTTTGDQTTSPGPAQVSAAAAELTAVRVELSRVDAKCSILTGLTGAAAAIVATQIRPTSPQPVAIALGVSAALLVTATLVLLLGVLRPRMGNTGFRAYRAADDETIAQLLGSEQQQYDALRVMSQIVNTKYLRLRVAVDLAAAGVVGIAVAALIAVLT